MASLIKPNYFLQKMIDFFLLIDEIDVIFVADKQAKKIGNESNRIRNIQQSDDICRAR